MTRGMGLISLAVAAAVLVAVVVALGRLEPSNPPKSEGPVVEAPAFCSSCDSRHSDLEKRRETLRKLHAQD